MRCSKGSKSKTRLVTIRTDNSVQEWINCWKLSMGNGAIYTLFQLSVMIASVTWGIVFVPVNVEAFTVFVNQTKKADSRQKGTAADGESP
jgi:hypothetical protein